MPRYKVTGAFTVQTKSGKSMGKFYPEETEIGAPSAYKAVVTFSNKLVNQVCHTEYIEMHEDASMNWRKERLYIAFDWAEVEDMCGNSKVFCWRDVFVDQPGRVRNE